MSYVVFYIAASEDGFTAKPDGSVDWLKIVEAEDEDYGYKEFYNSIDALIMGSKTYEVTLGFGDWVYKGKPTYVLTNRPFTSDEDDVHFTGKSPAEVLKMFDEKGYNKIWLVGGGELASSMIGDDLVDEMIISIIPIKLNEGIPIFTGNKEKLDQFELVKEKSFDSDLVQHFYKRTPALTK